VRRFLRYACFYCASRLLFGFARSAMRAKPAPSKPCGKHGRGILLTLALLPFWLAACLCVLGFIIR